MSNDALIGTLVSVAPYMFGMGKEKGCARTRKVAVGGLESVAVKTSWLLFCTTISPSFEVPAQAFTSLCQTLL